LSKPPRGARSFLFLQGPASDFFDQVGRALLARGHRVHRVNLHLGDRLFWHLPATNFRGRRTDWRHCVAGILDRHCVTDLVLMGPDRPYHVVAAEEARARGIAVICTDLGYLRPDWITPEQDGVTSWSRLPHDSRAIAELAACFPPPDMALRFRTPFALLAVTDLAYNLGELVGRPLYPHYRRHAIFHPLAEYAGWISALVRRAATRGRTERERARLEGGRGAYFLFPLQLATDFQLRAHAPYPDQREAIRDVLASFAASGTAHSLVIVVHPLDNGLIAWRRVALRHAAELGLAGRVVVLEGGITGGLLRRASGVVTINSTVGLTALQEQVPVKVLGNAVFDIPGLTCQAALDAFWHVPQRSDPDLLRNFLRVVAGTTQVKGGYFQRGAKAAAIAEAARRLDEGLPTLPPRHQPARAAYPGREPARRGIVITGASRGIGLALARVYAGPDVAMCLLGRDRARLETAAEDCRRRGAIVEAVCVDVRDEPALRRALADFDARVPVHLVIANAGVSGGLGPDRSAEPADSARRIIEVNLLGAMATVDALVEPMRARGRGHIVLVSSISAMAPTADLPAYSASKAGLLAYGHSLRRWLRRTGVRVSVVCPGFVESAMSARHKGPRPMLMTADRAAAVIRRGIDAGRRVIAFPWLLALGVRALSLLPYGIADRILDGHAATIEPDDENGGIAATGPARETVAPAPRA